MSSLENSLSGTNKAVGLIDYRVDRLHQKQLFFLLNLTHYVFPFHFFAVILYEKAVIISSKENNFRTL